MILGPKFGIKVPTLLKTSSLKNELNMGEAQRDQAMRMFLRSLETDLLFKLKVQQVMEQNHTGNQFSRN